MSRGWRASAPHDVEARSGNVIGQDGWNKSDGGDEAANVWLGLCGPPVAARARIGGPDAPGHNANNDLPDHIPVLAPMRPCPGDARKRARLPCPLHALPQPHANPGNNGQPGLLIASALNNRPIRSGSASRCAACIIAPARAGGWPCARRFVR